MILTDNETKVDLLNYEGIAITITQLLKEKPDKPITIGVHGDWGAGKSSVLEMIESAFTDDEKVLCLKFNGWRFQGFEDAKIALIEGIVTALIEKRPALKKAGDAVKETLSRIDWLKIAKKGGGMAWTAMTGIPTPDQIQDVIGLMRGWIDAPTKHVTKENVESAASQLGGLLKAPDTKRVPEEIEEFRKAFSNLLAEAKIEQLVVLIDDLDRCLPDTAIETLEAVRLFVFTERTAFIVAADEAMIEYAVRKHFPDLPDTTGPRDYARNYLEKLIQVPFRIPSLGEAETRIYVTLLLIGAELGENDPTFEKLIEIARDRLKKPWASSYIDITTISATLGERFKEIKELVILSEQISPILAGGTKGNPRQVKRFLNTLILRKRIADARGFGEDINLPALAKLMLAERFMPSLFDAVASSAADSPDGICKELKMLEENLGAKTQSKKDDKKTKSDDSIVSKWLKAETITSWASLEPKLGETDLRPYLFVSKDKKDYFSANTTMGKLVAISEKMMGAKLVVTGLISELKELSPAEALQIFEDIKVKIISKDDFSKQPPGIDGLIALAGNFPELSHNLIDFLGGLPAKKLGAWVVRGWGNIFNSPELDSKFGQLLHQWEAVEGNSILKAAASGTIKTRSK